MENGFEESCDGRRLDSFKMNHDTVKYDRISETDPIAYLIRIDKYSEPT
jgi:hypothetical protein